MSFIAIILYVWSNELHIFEREQKVPFKDALWHFEHPPLAKNNQFFHGCQPGTDEIHGVYSSPPVGRSHSKILPNMQRGIFFKSSSASFALEDLSLSSFQKMTPLNTSDFILNQRPLESEFLKLSATTTFYFKCWTNKSHLTWVFCNPECVRCWKASARISKTILRQN